MAAGGTTIQRGNILYGNIYAPTLTPAVVASNNTAEQTFTQRGLLAGDFVVNLDVVNAAQTPGIMIAYVRVPTNDTLVICFANITSSNATPVAGAYTFQVSRAEGTIPPN